RSDAFRPDDLARAGECAEILDRVFDGTPRGAVTRDIRLEMEGDDLETAMLAVHLRIDRPDELFAVEDGHRPEAARTQVFGHVDLDAVPHAEEQLGALTIDDEVVEWRQQDRPVDRLGRPIEIPWQRKARTAQAGDLDAPRDAFALEARQRLQREEPAQGGDAPGLLEGRGTGRRGS